MRGFPAILVLAVSLRAGGAERPAFQTLRYNEDWSFLRDPSQRTDLFDPVKYVSLDTNENWYLSFGGEARLKYELYTEPVFNQTPADDNGDLLQRYLLYADLHATPYFRVFGQLQSSLEKFRNGGPRPSDRDELGQEMAYGSQRLISVRESPNNRLAFDAARILTHFGNWQADAWIAQPVNIDPGMFDDRRIEENASCDFVWRASLDDGVYGVALNLQVPPGTSQARYVGTFPSFGLTWQAQRHLSLALNYVPYLLGLTLGPVIRSWNFVLSNALFNACVVSGLTWVVMPLITTLLRSWLNPPPRKEGKTM